MLVDLDVRGDICVLRLHGRFDTGRDSAYLRGKTEEIKTGGHAMVLADLSQVDYIDSTGIGFLIGIYIGQFVLASLNRRVREVLELTRIAQVIPIFSTEEAAITALRERHKLSASQAG
jgi:anti-anti-sigma factor